MGLWPVGGGATFFQLGSMALFSKMVAQKVLGIVSRHRSLLDTSQAFFY